MDHPWKKWERQVGELISRWLSGGRRKDLIARQSLMGRMVERKYGDMATHPDCIDRWRPASDWFMKTYQVDAKNRKAFRLGGMLSQQDNPFWQWWAKLTHDTAMSGGKQRMMFLQHQGLHVLVLGARELEWGLHHGVDSDRAPIPSYILSRGKEDDRVFLFQAEGWLKFADPAKLGCPGPVGGQQDEAVATPGDVRPGDVGQA